MPSAGCRRQSGSACGCRRPPGGSRHRPRPARAATAGGRQRAPAPPGCPPPPMRQTAPGAGRPSALRRSRAPHAGAASHTAPPGPAQVRVGQAGRQAGAVSSGCRLQGGSSGGGGRQRLQAAGSFKAACRIGTYEHAPSLLTWRMAAAGPQEHRSSRQAARSGAAGLLIAWHSCWRCPALSAERPGAAGSPASRGGRSGSVLLPHAIKR